MFRSLGPAHVLAGLLISSCLVASARGTWSICIADSETKEVAVGTVTCLGAINLQAFVPVVVVEKGTGASQALGDSDGLRRPVIFNGLVAGDDPADILLALEPLALHEQRQYGIADTQGRTLTFTGAETLRWAGGLTGSQGSMVYAVQGNILTGDCVVPAIERALLDTDGDIPDKLMAGMQAARSMGGDGRCSCSPADPTGCGCPPPSFVRSGYTGTMIVARVGDTDDPACNAGGCADGGYFMNLNIAFAPVGARDPVVRLQDDFDEFRAAHVGVTDAIHSTVGIPLIQPNGISATTMTVALLDWQDLPITVPVQSVDVVHAPDSAGLSSIGAVTDQGGGVYTIRLTAGASPGVDRFVVTATPTAEGAGPITLMPNPRFEYFQIGDSNGDGVVGVDDFLDVLAKWGPCPDPCAADTNGDGIVGVDDFLNVLANWTT